MGLIMVQRKNDIPGISRFMGRGCMICGSSKWIKITLIKGANVGVNFTLCPNCARELTCKINRAIQKEEG